VSQHKRKDGGMVKPKKAKGKRRKIGHDCKHGPGGPHTPGAKKKSKKKRKGRGA